jgi:hypothetical protein
VTEERHNHQSVNGGLEKSPELPYRRCFWLLACAWTAAVAGSLAWNLADHAGDVRA